MQIQMNHVSKLCPHVVFYRETSLVILSSMMFSVNASRYAEYLHAKCFFTSDIYDASSTVFADDITKRTVTNTPQEVITKMEEKSRMLRKFAADIGIVMNRSKEERQVGFVGPGSVTSMRMLHREGKWPDRMGKSCPTPRVLGTLLTYNCGNVAERQARSRAAQAGWTVMGRFWSVPSESNVLFSAAWSGRHS